jgi:hypothetical protein
LVAASAMSGRDFIYFEHKYVFEGPPKPEPREKFPFVEHHCLIRALTQVGQQLAKVANPEPVAGYVESLSQALLEEIGVSLREM